MSETLAQEPLTGGSATRCSAATRRRRPRRWRPCAKRRSALQTPSARRSREPSSVPSNVGRADSAARPRCATQRAPCRQAKTRRPAPGRRAVDRRSDASLGRGIGDPPGHAAHAGRAHRAHHGHAAAGRGRPRTSRTRAADGSVRIMPGRASGTAVPIDAAMARARRPRWVWADPMPVPNGEGADWRRGTRRPDQWPGAADAEPSESIFIPGRAGDGPTDNRTTCRSRYHSRRAAARSRSDRPVRPEGRDYVDHAPFRRTVRELVRQYFAELEGQ